MVILNETRLGAVAVAFAAAMRLPFSRLPWPMIFESIAPCAGHARQSDDCSEQSDLLPWLKSYHSGWAAASSIRS